MAPEGSYTVYVGTYTQSLPHVEAKAEGIYVYRMDPLAGALASEHVTAGVVNPSYLALDPSRRYLYAVNEVGGIDGQAGGAVSAFAVDPSTGVLTYLNRQPTFGAAPCHVSVDPTGKFVLVANYGGGSVAMLPVQADGRLGPPSDFIQHQGSSVNPRRQQGPHAHSINLDPSGRFALVPDLGLDRVVVYRLDRERGKLVASGPGLAARPGSGPRHLDFHPNGRWVYVIHEIDATLSLCEWDEAAGTLREVKAVSTLPEGFDGPKSCADVHVHPSGRFVYGSNRGHDSIVVFAVDPASGRLSLVGHESTRGQAPRNFVIDPTGTWLLAANQNTSDVVTFRIDQETGRLGAVALTSIPTPVCLKFA